MTKMMADFGLLLLLVTRMAAGSEAAGSEASGSEASGSWPRGCPTGDFTIPDGTTRIPTGAFMGCSDLTSVVIPDSV